MGTSVQRLRVNIGGIVQGVGFRPFVYRLAKETALNGWVTNDSNGVTIEIEGSKHKIAEFVTKLEIEKPPLASIENIKTSEIEPCGEQDFLIQESAEGLSKRVPVSPDYTLCEDCLAELNNPEDRRYRYHFINCTNCGPRFTITKKVPYDRINTSMADFELCPDCYKEYIDPGNRRFHAQPNACPKCGPKLVLFSISGQGEKSEGIEKPIQQAIHLLKQGQLLAVKGLGGYHLVCDAVNEAAVNKLRSRKIREDKPFAIMARSVTDVNRFCYVSSKEEELLKDKKRPIVLLKKKDKSLIASGVAPNNSHLGVMLPYTPLHYLLLEEFPDGLVMTSGNLSSEPIAYKEEEWKRLKGIANYVLTHNRPIVHRCDDSVTRIFRRREMILRRARGYAPEPIKLPFYIGEVLACGAELKNTFTLAKENKVYIGHHIGDLTNLEAYDSYVEGIEHYKGLFDIKPSIIAHDLHPEYLSTKYAVKQQEVKKIGVQHHHAHIVSCLVDNGIKGPVIGVAFDGTGYGTDGCLWGGEFMVCDYKDFKRLGHLDYVPMPSGEKAIEEPWRMALAYLHGAFGEKLWNLDSSFVEGLDNNIGKMLLKSMEKRINAPLTSSMGRLFDTVSALLNIRKKVNYEGQAAIELEQIADSNVQGCYKFDFIEKQDLIIINPLPTIKEIVMDLTDNKQDSSAVSRIAGKFHNTIAEITLEMCMRIKQRTSLKEVALSGGVWQNILLLDKVIHKLEENDFKVFWHNKIPPNDGGVSLGQALIAFERSRA